MKIISWRNVMLLVYMCWEKNNINNKCKNVGTTLLNHKTKYVISENNGVGENFSFFFYRLLIGHVIQICKYSDILHVHVYYNIIIYGRASI